MPHTNDASAASSGSNGQSTIGEAIYALTDEQILDIDDAEVAPPPRDAGTQQGVILSEGDASASCGQAGKDQRPGVPAPMDERISTANEPQITNHESRLAHYAASERAANDDLDRAVRPEIARVLERALPVGNNEPARTTQERLSGLVRTEIEAALRQDRALGEQVAQLLRSRTFDDATRAQVVRLIAARATSLVPAASRRVLSEWTQSALAAHRARRSLTGATDAARDPSSSPATAASPAPSAAKPRPAKTATLGTTHTASRRINYRALSDEEILDL